MLEAIVTCVNYDDFLAITAKSNQKYFDGYIVVTALEDSATQNFCKNEKIDCFVTDAFTKNGATFNKGLAINVGFKGLKYHDWILLIDADIVLPESFDKLLGINNLDKECFYGCRRYSLPTYNDYQNRNLENNILYRGFGYGYFQLFNWQSSTLKKLADQNGDLIYPSHITTNQESDWMFRNNWGDIVYNPPLKGDFHKDENNDYGLGLLKELKNIQVMHLGLDSKNFNGRKTERFL